MLRLSHYHNSINRSPTTELFIHGRLYATSTTGLLNKLILLQLHVKKIHIRFMSGIGKDGLKKASKKLLENNNKLIVPTNAGLQSNLSSSTDTSSSNSRNSSPEKSNPKPVRNTNTQEKLKDRSGLVSTTTFFKNDKKPLIYQQVRNATFWAKKESTFHKKLIKGDKPHMVATTQKFVDNENPDNEEKLAVLSTKKNSYKHNSDINSTYKAGNTLVNGSEGQQMFHFKKIFVKHGQLHEHFEYAGSNKEHDTALKEIHNGKKEALHQINPRKPFCIILPDPEIPNKSDGSVQNQNITSKPAKDKTTNVKCNGNNTINNKDD